MRLKGKVAIITGAARGIGAKCAELFVREGSAVALWDTNAERGRATTDAIAASGAKAIFCACDVTNAVQIQQAVDQTVAALGLPTVLLNNAGIAINGTVENLTEEQWDHQYAVNVKSIFLVSRVIILLMRKSGSGSIINMASESAFVGFPMHPAYCSSKAAVVHLSRCMATRYAPEKIRVNSLCPGTIRTDLQSTF